LKLGGVGKQVIWFSADGVDLGTMRL